MPRADVGTEQTSMSGERKKGEFKVKYTDIAEKTMKPKSPDSQFRESLRVTFDIVGKEDDTVSLGVVVEEPANDLRGFVGNPTAAPKDSETALRQFIETNIVREPVEVYVNGFIRSRLALEGTHVFEKIIAIYPYDKGQPRIGMTAITKDGLTTNWNCKDPQLRKERGERNPDSDYIGGDGELNPNQFAFVYLQAFGLNWEKMKQEDLPDAAAYWPGHYDKDGVPIEPLFPSLENPWPGFLDIIERHGGNPVKIDVVRDDTYGLGPPRVGQFPHVKMTPIEREDNAEFGREKALFLELWDNLTKVTLSNDAARFVAGGDFTEDGKAVALATLVPLVRAYPAAVTQKKPDGTPAVYPPSPETWTLDGLVAANFTAERLLKLGTEDLFNCVHLNDKEAKNLLAWAAENVTEWADVGQGRETEAL